jgi:photosynthetic reaction center H subunit
MQPQLVGDITGYVDLPQILLYVFWIFFAALIYYLCRESHREGYPMESDGLDRAVVKGFPVPPPKTFIMEGGKKVVVPDMKKGEPPRAFKSAGASPGSPIDPTGNPMLDGVGAGAYAIRADHPDHNPEGHAKIVPLRTAKAYGVASADWDPRGLPVFAGDDKHAGVVRDLWVDTSEMMFRYLEVEVPSPTGARRVLLPVPFARIRRNKVEVNSIYAHHFAQVPGLKNPDVVTMFEEERISAFYGGGTLYADKKRSEPWM